jgi:hypothetical protein
VLRLEIAAQVTGPQTGLHYKWFAVAGGCDPQESNRPRTSFKFADGTTRDRVSENTADEITKVLKQFFAEQGWIAP